MKGITIFFLVLFSVIQLSTQQCSCPQTYVGSFDYSSIVTNMRTLIFAVQAGKSYDFIIPSNTDTVTFDTCGSTDDTYLSLYNTACNTLLDFNDDNCNFQSQITFTANGRTTLRLVVNGRSCSASPFSKVVNLYMTIAPIITFNIPPNFENFGQIYGDTLLPRCDDCSTTQITLPKKIQFFQKKYNSLYVNTNGVVALTQAIYSTTPLNFPAAGKFVGSPVIAPFWADADTRPKDGGYVMYRVSTAPTPQANIDISNIFGINFVSDMEVIITWYEIAYFPEETDLLNTFQLILYTDSAVNFTIARFNYAANGINWVTGSGGLNGFGGYPAKVGFDKGDGISSFSLANSYTEDIQYVDNYSNVDFTGVYYYRIDNKTIIDPSACIPSVSCKASASLNVGDVPSFADVNFNSSVCDSTIVRITPDLITCAMYPSTSVRLHLDYFSCALQVTVSDPEPPVFTECTSNPITLVSTDPDICATRFTPNVTDNCGISVYPITYTAPPGPSSNTFYTTDIAGNQVSCTFNFMVVDYTPPVAKCKTISVFLDTAGVASTTASAIDNSSTDNCGLIASTSATHTSYSCADLGASYAILSVVDTNGNVGTCNATVNVVDNVKPTPLCQTSIVIPIVTNSAPISVSNIDMNSYDNCQVASKVLSSTTITCANTVSPLPVTLTVTDQSSNSNTCVTSVYANDITPPTARCKDITKRFSGTENFIVITPSDIDNGSSDNCGIQSLAITGNNKLPKGSIGGPVRMLATDVNGLTSTCSAYVTTPIGRDDFLVIPAEIQMEIPFEITWPTTTDFPSDSSISLRAIDTETYFTTSIVTDYLFNRLQYTVKGGLHGVSPNRNYLIVMTQGGIDYASQVTYLEEFHKGD